MGGGGALSNNKNPIIRIWEKKRYVLKATNGETQARIKKISEKKGNSNNNNAKNNTIDNKYTNSCNSKDS